MKKIKAYLAAPIFTEAARDYNEKIAIRLEKEFPFLELYVPQRNKAINDKTKCATAEQICQGDFDNNLDKDDIIIAVVDGDLPGVGTTLEIGYFARRCQDDINTYGKTNKRIFSLYTDSRECSHTWSEEKNEKLKEIAECQYAYLNLLLVGCLKRYGQMASSIDDLVEAMKDYFSERGVYF